MFYGDFCEHCNERSVSTKLDSQALYGVHAEIMEQDVEGHVLGLLFIKYEDRISHHLGIICLLLHVSAKL